jgi:hypothetical protein
MNEISNMIGDANDPVLTQPGNDPVKTRNKWFVQLMFIVVLRRYDGTLPPSQASRNAS